MRNIPNAITLLRIALIPLLALMLLRRDYHAALMLFVVSALSDLADGLIARHWNARSRFGAIADPLADKLTMLTVALLLALHNWLPWWFAFSVVIRDVVIVSGALAYHALIGQVEIAPSGLSKLNTALEFLLLTSVLAIAAGHLDAGAWSRYLLLTTWITIVLSGAHYVLLWSRKAAQVRGNPK
jgi:cardiolipin synthase (CMP-forming)